MEEPVFGLCPLCSQQKQVERSHYLGRALHLLSQDDSGAVFMTPQHIKLSTRQIWAHLLCGECEDILAANESYAHQWINREDRFPLLERLRVAEPVRWTPNGTEFSWTAIGVSTERWHTLRSAYIGGPEAEFRHELGVFGNEVEEAIQCFYAEHSRTGSLRALLKHKIGKREGRQWLLRFQRLNCRVELRQVASRDLQQI
jgi:hypothetical protein